MTLLPPAKATPSDIWPPDAVPDDVPALNVSSDDKRQPT